MAISRSNGCRDLLVEALRLCGKPLPEVRIAEMGNQRYRDERATRWHLTSIKRLLEFFGATVYSFDRNGKDGAIPVDLSKWIEDGNMEGQFDIVTNFGTLEHVRENQAAAFRNLHYLCAKGGLIVHHMPYVRFPERHGKWRYSVRWFERLARDNAYRAIQVSRFDKATTDFTIQPGRMLYIHAILQKRSLRRFNTKAFEQPSRR